MKKTLLTCISLLLTQYSFSQNCALTNTAFQKGEELKYAFSFKWGAMWLSAGEAKMSISEEPKDAHFCYHIVGIGNTYRSYDWFFKVRDDYESYIDMYTLRPVRFIRDINEGGYDLKQNVHFDDKTTTATSTKRILSITDCTHDVLSAVYYLRNYDMSHVQPGQIIPLTVYIDDSLYNLTIEYVGKEVISNKFGTYNTLKLKPTTIKGTIFKDSDKMIVWVSDDANHIPIAISSPILIGELRADLINAKGLRYALNGTINE